MGATWQLPGYQVLELVGFGGSGEVWRARDELTGETVALKRLRCGDDSVARERLRREAAILSSVAGEHVVRVRDLVSTASEAVLVMDYAEGGNLATILAVRGELAGPEIVTLVAPLASALADAHDRGIVHGDVSPANIVFAADGRPLLTDFGVARAVGSVAAEVEVTVPYVAPEVLAGAPAGPAADVYALCRVAATALSRAVAPQGLVAAIEAGLADDPHERPDARRLASDVLSACAAAPVRLVRAAPVVPPAVTASVRVGPPVTPPEDCSQRPGGAKRAHRRTPRRPRLPGRLIVALTASAVLALAVAGGVVWGHRSQSSAAVLQPRPLPDKAIPSAPAVPDWLDVVRRLEALRTRAITTGDGSLLAGVYAAGSPPAEADSALLGRLSATHQHAVGFTMAALRVQVVSSAPTRVTLLVTDQVSAYELTGDGRRMQVAATGARTLTMVLVPAGAGWRIADVRRPT